MEAKNGRPTKYDGEKTIERVQAYLDACHDEETEFHATRGEKSDTYQRLVRVRIPTIEGLALALDLHKDTLYQWKSEYPDFSDVIDKAMKIQANRLMENGLNGTYNPTIAKVLLAKHGYRDGIEMTGANGGAIEIDDKTKDKKDSLIQSFLEEKK